MDKENIIEKLAKLEHEQWLDWSHNIADTEEISKKRLRRWDKLWVNYNILTDKQKEADRIYARKILPILEQEIEEGAKSERERIIRLIKNRTFNSGLVDSGFLIEELKGQLKQKHGAKKCMK